MNIRRLIGRLLAVFVIVGLVAAPIITPAAAMRLRIVQMSAMSGDMPCCPDGQKNKSCQHCPLVALCMLTMAQAEPYLASSIRAALPTHVSLFSAFDDLIADGLMGSPPDHPPRTSI